MDANHQPSPGTQFDGDWNLDYFDPSQPHPVHQSSASNPLPHADSLQQPPVASLERPQQQQLPLHLRVTNPALPTSNDPFHSQTESSEQQYSGAQARPFFRNSFALQDPSSPGLLAVFTPLSDSQVLTGAAPSPFTYHAPTHAQNTIQSPLYRSMSLPENDSAVEAQTFQPNAFLPTPKQIRFVSTDGQPHTKRRRINAACLTCRKRKTRCSGERPICKTCIDNGHSCAGYVERPSRKSIGKASLDDDEDEEEDELGDSTPRRHKIPTQFTTPVNEVVSQMPPMVRKESVESNIAKDALDFKSPESTHTANSSSVSLKHRIPFFRYFGPTAIVPGFKQMVVQVKDRDHRRTGLSISGESPSSGPQTDSANFGREQSPQEVVFYDATDPGPVAPLITHLCETFFTNLGCSFPFLERERFMRDLEDKRVDVILVDAVCAIAARFSSNPGLARPSDESTPVDENGEVKRAFRGQPYAQRAASVLVDTFGSPTTAVAQASLLLAYEEFGTDRDSGLWMMLGVACRMAVDIGLHRLEGMQLSGRIGSTPKTAKAPNEEGKHEEQRRAAQQEKLTQALMEQEEAENLDDRRASEEERIDSFWAIFFLDRTVSSGVGRPATLRDKDIEISFPYRPDEMMVNGYPHPFPVMIRIVHLYGRISDVINNIQGSTEINSEGLKKLTSMEKDLTGIYQKMSPRLHFNPTNFQHYVKAQQGTNFILLHFWFHTSIILLHQPTLLCSLETHIQQLFPDSRDLSMSSAKTIADILAFAELIDVRSFIGNPFTSQPMYVAACAFLAEARAHASHPSSRQTTPQPKSKYGSGDSKPGPSSGPSELKTAKDSKLAARHSLLATTANQNYQVCYKALQLLNTYWSGCRYILTALDQKSKGLPNPMLFTRDDIDGEMPSVEPSFTQPGWRRSSHGPSPADRRTSIPWSPRMDWSQAIGWSLTGTTNSPAPNLSFLYPNLPPDKEKNGNNGPQGKKQQQAPSNLRNQHARRSSHNHEGSALTTNEKQGRSMMPPPASRMGSLPYDPVSAADADLLLGLHSPYSVSSGGLNQQAGQQPTTPSFEYNNTSPGLQHQPSTAQNVFYTPPTNNVTTPGFTDMLIESQDVDMSNQAFQPHFDTLNLPGSDMFWLEYLPQDVLSYFSHTGESGQSTQGTGVDPSGMVMPSGPGPPGSSS